MVVIAWFAFSILVGYLAKNKGRDAGRWFVMSLLLSPIIVGLFLLASKDLTEQVGLETKEFKKCLYCAETIKREASKCKHCGADLPVV